MTAKFFFLKVHVWIWIAICFFLLLLQDFKALCVRKDTRPFRTAPEQKFERNYWILSLSPFQKIISTCDYFSLVVLFFSLSLQEKLHILKFFFSQTRNYLKLEKYTTSVSVFLECNKEKQTTLPSVQFYFYRQLLHLSFCIWHKKLAFMHQHF